MLFLTDVYATSDIKKKYILLWTFCFYITIVFLLIFLIL